MKLLFLGHSLVEYFDWQGRFPEHQVVNLGVAGETTGGLLSRVAAFEDSHDNADVVFVMTGTNDILMAKEGFTAEVREIAGRLRARNPRGRIVLQSVLPVHPDWASPETIVRSNAAIRLIAEETGADYLDLTESFADREGHPRLELLLDDGVHLGAEGYRLWSKAVEGVLPPAASNKYK